MRFNDCHDERRRVDTPGYPPRNDLDDVSVRRSGPGAPYPVAPRAMGVALLPALALLAWCEGWLAVWGVRR
jgi:hypothetical protein